MHDQEGEAEHLELVINDHNKDEIKERLIKPDRTYGTLLSVKPRV